MSNFDFTITAKGGHKKLLKEIANLEPFEEVGRVPWRIRGKTFAATLAWQKGALDIELTGQSPLMQWAVDNGFTLMPHPRHKGVRGRLYEFIETLPKGPSHA